MGNLPGSPVDDAKRQEIADLVKAVLETFTSKYIVAYKKALIQKVIEDKLAAPEPERSLLVRPPNTDPVRTGYLIKRGEVAKNWKKRFFVVRADYIVEYYESEEKWKSGGKSKGRMMLNGFQVVTEPNKRAFEHLAEVFKELQITDQVPEQNTFKDLTIEMFHPTRRCWYIQCKDEEEFKSWTETFKAVCWRAPSLSNDDPVARTAFHSAVRETRWHLGRWGWWSYGGSEEDILTDMVADHINYVILGDIWRKIEGAPKAKRMVRDSVESAIQSSIRTMVGPIWKAAAASVLQIRPTLENGLKSNIDPVIDAQNKAVDSLKAKVIDKVNPALQETVVPALAKLIQVFCQPLTGGYGELIKIWQTRIMEFEEVAAASGTGDVDQVGRDLKRFAHSWWSISPAYYKMREFHEPLSLLGEVASHIWPWSIIWEIEEKMERLLDDAMYTFEHDLKEKTADGTAKADGIAAKAAVEATRLNVLERFRTDALRAVVDVLNGVLMKIVMPPLEKVVVGPCMELIQPLEEAIPEAIRDFVSIARCFENFLIGTVEDTISGVVTPACAGVKFE